MRILVLSNFYPPHAIGGMEHRCQETVDRLCQRGHEVVVLTSMYGVEQPMVATNGNVYRQLHLESDLAHYQPLHFFTTRRQQERQNLAYLKKLTDSFTPDIVFIWGLWNLSSLLAEYAEFHYPGRVVYSLANDWPAQPDMHTAYWQLSANRKSMKPVKMMLSKLALAMLKHKRGNITLKFGHAICVSYALHDQLLDAGVSPEDVRIIYPGINVEQFLHPQMPKTQTTPEKSLSLLYAGSLVPHKGVHTAIEAVAQLVDTHFMTDLNLTIVGVGHPDYEAILQSMVKERGLEEYVHFYGRVFREEMPALLRCFDILLFPSIWEEPFARMPLEAMAAGLVVIGTPTGGTKELLVDGVNGLTFEPGDAAALAKQIQKLRQNPELLTKLAQNARSAVVKQFDIRRMIDEIETYLEQVIQGTPIETIIRS